MSNLFLMLVAFSLVLLNALFVAAEFGMVKLRHTRVMAIKKNYGIRGSILEEVHKHLDAYLSACQLGITLASLGLGWVGEPAFAHLFAPIFDLLGLPTPQAAQATALVIAFLFITFLHIVVGELVPKTIAIRQAEFVSIWTALPLYGFYWLMYPVIWLMNGCSNMLVRLTKFGRTEMGDHFYSADEIKLILHSSYAHGELTNEERKILEQTLDLGELKVTDVMRPIDEMVTLDIHKSVTEALQTIRQYRYSRYPVYDHTAGQVIGIIHIKDFYSALYQDKESMDLASIMRPVLKVSRRLPALALLRKFRQGMPHFALIYSGKEENLIGFVTLDNLLYVILGRIKDEFHRTQDDWIQDQDGSFLMRGNTSIYTLERALDIDIDTELENMEEIDTLNGLIFSRLESIPKVGQRIAFNQFDILVEKMRGPHILQLRIYRHEKQE